MTGSTILTGPMRGRRLPALLHAALEWSSILAVGVAGPLLAQDTSATHQAARVRAAFLHAWNGYEQYAWGHDQLRPLSREYRDWYPASLVMTPVDAFDTMLLMR